MIINNKGTDVQFSGETKKAQINMAQLSKLGYLLTHGLYQDGISATLVELSNNALDSVIQSGKNPMDNPIFVTLGQDNNGKYFLSVKDQGLGLNKYEFENVVMNYLTSTKEDSNDVIGSFGIGAKSWLSVSKSATFICIKDGLKWEMLCFQGSEFLEYTELSCQETTEPNGVEVIIPIKDSFQFNEFRSKALQKLGYYDNLILKISGVVVQNKISRTKDFQWNSMHTFSEMHLTLKDVHYSISWDKLGISSITVPIALRLSLEEGISVVPSRESIIYNPQTIELLKQKITDVSNWFVDKYKAEIQSFPDFLSAFPHIDSYTKFVDLQGTRFQLDSMITFLKTSVPNLKIVGVNLLTPEKYKSLNNTFFSDYDKIADWTHKWKKERIYSSIGSYAVVYKRKIVVLDETPRGNVKEYLKQKYNNCLFVKKGKPVTLQSTGRIDNVNYYSILGLDRYPKREWRDIIKEYVYVEKTIYDQRFVVETDIENKTEYQTWLQRKLALAKAKRKPAKKRVKVDLTKGVGDITLGYLRSAIHQKHEGVIERKVISIASIHKQNFLTIVCEDVALAKQLFSLAHVDPNIRIATIASRDKKHLPKVHNLKTYEEFMYGIKSFKRIATAIRAKKALHDFDKIYADADSITIVQQALPRMDKLRDQLVSYKMKYSTDVNIPIAESIFKVAETKNLWDESFIDKVKSFEEQIKTFNFVRFMKPAKHFASYQATDITDLKNVINQFLLFQKVHKNKLEGYELVKPNSQLLKTA